MASVAPSRSTTTPLSDLPVATPSTLTSPSQPPAPASFTNNFLMDTPIEADMVREEDLQRRIDQRQLQTARPPPPGLHGGGVWGEMNDVGCKSMILVTVGCLIVGPLW